MIRPEHVDDDEKRRSTIDLKDHDLKDHSDEKREERDLKDHSDEKRENRDLKDHSDEKREERDLLEELSRFDQLYLRRKPTITTNGSSRRSSDRKSNGSRRRLNDKKSSKVNVLTLRCSLTEKKFRTMLCTSCIAILISISVIMVVGYSKLFPPEIVMYYGSIINYTLVTMIGNMIIRYRQKRRRLIQGDDDSNIDRRYMDDREVTPNDVATMGQDQRGNFNDVVDLGVHRGVRRLGGYRGRFVVSMDDALNILKQNLKPKTTDMAGIWSMTTSVSPKDTKHVLKCPWSMYTNPLFLLQMKEPIGNNFSCVDSINNSWIDSIDVPHFSGDVYTEGIPEIYLHTSTNQLIWQDDNCQTWTINLDMPCSTPVGLGPDTNFHKNLHQNDDRFRHHIDPFRHRTGRPLIDLVLVCHRWLIYQVNYDQRETIALIYSLVGDSRGQCIIVSFPSARNVISWNVSSDRQHNILYVFWTDKFYRQNITNNCNVSAIDFEQIWSHFRARITASLQKSRALDIMIKLENCVVGVIPVFTPPIPEETKRCDSIAKISDSLPGIQIREIDWNNDKQDNSFRDSRFQSYIHWLNASTDTLYAIEMTHKDLQCFEICNFIHTARERNVEQYAFVCDDEKRIPDRVYPSPRVARKVDRSLIPISLLYIYSHMYPQNSIIVLSNNTVFDGSKVYSVIMGPAEYPIPDPCTTSILTHSKRLRRPIVILDHSYHPKFLWVRKHTNDILLEYRLPMDLINTIISYVFLLFPHSYTFFTFHLPFQVVF